MDNAINKIYEFTMIPIFEKYYNEDSSWGVFNFSTKDDIPYLNEYKDPFQDPIHPEDTSSQKMSSIAGKMQQLYLGSEYKVTAKLEYNNKYSSWQYNPISIVANTPKSYETQLKFLQAMINNDVAENLLKAYPNIVEEVIKGERDTIDYNLIKGVREATWNRIKNSIIDNYVVSDIIIMLQPLGVTYTMIKRLLSEEPNPSLLKEQLEENPYIVTKIRGIGFSRADNLALKLKPELRHSMYRLVAFIKFYLRDIGEQNGHTWVTHTILENSISDNVPECMDLLKQLLSSNTFLYQEDDKIGLLSYRTLEEKIFNILLEKTQFKNEKFQFTDEEILLGIKQAEDEQGFKYTDEQIRCIIEAVNSNVAIISGKGGTGKTSISRAIFTIYKNKNMCINAMALSAKAAQRITEATQLPAKTIHRALDALGLNKFTYNHDNPLQTDVVFVDESSMINARLFYDLLSAISENTKVIICGDCMQLPPIGYGNIFSDILSRNDIFNSMQLMKVMRQAELSGILSDANKIRDGINPIDSPELKIIHGELHDMYYMFRNNREALQHIAIQTYLKSIVTDGMEEVVIATPRKQDCINSSFEINKIIQDELVGNKPYIDLKYIKFHIGAKVIQTVNDYEKNIFNGEIGYVTDIYKKKIGSKEIEYCSVTFKNVGTGVDKIIEYKKTDCDQLELAYALTVHKLQGSGYKTVIGIVDNTHYNMLDNCMLYTLITRAKKRCLLLAEPDAFLKCIRVNNNLKRQTWLKFIKTK